MDQYDEEIAAMEEKLDRLSRLVVVLPADSPERADVQDEGLLLYRELEDARATLTQRRRRDAEARVQEDRVRRYRAEANRRSGNWARAAAWTLTPGGPIVLISLPMQSWAVRLVGLALVIVGALCLLRMAQLQRQASEGPTEEVHRTARFRSTGQSPSASNPASAPERPSTSSQFDTLELPRNGSS